MLQKTVWQGHLIGSPLVFPGFPADLPAVAGKTGPAVGTVDPERAEMAVDCLMTRPIQMSLEHSFQGFRGSNQSQANSMVAKTRGHEQGSHTLWHHYATPS